VHYVPAEKGGIMRRGVNVLLAAAIAAAWGTCAGAQTQPTLEQDAVAFGTRPAAASLDLSPDGSRAVFVGAGPGRTTMVYVADIAAGTNKAIPYSKGSPETIEWCAFASVARLVCRFTAMIQSDGSAAPVGVLIPTARTISLKLDGSDIKPLGQPSTSTDLGIRQYDGSVIDWLPSSGNDVLMTRLFLAQDAGGEPTNVLRSKHGIGVVRLNVETLGADIVEQPIDNAATWMSDGQGRVRLLGTLEYSGETYDTGRVKYVYRTPGSRDWKEFGGYTKLLDFQPLAIDGGTNDLYAVRNFDGRWALSRVSLGDSPNETVVAHDSSHDVDRVETIGRRRHVIGYGFEGQLDQTNYIDPEYKKLADKLEAALPNHPTVKFVAESDDRSKIALYAGRQVDPGRFLLFDESKKLLGELVPVRPNLAGRPLADVRSVTYPASDGSMLGARLFLPPGATGRNLPTVIFTGGDEGYSDDHGFDWLAQFLAVRGYAVFEPEYHGFGGGDAWFNTVGFKEWRTSAADIAAAVTYIVGQGVADPARLAIVGWSHGGYAALLSAETAPARYKAVVAIAPITNLASYKEDWSDYTAGKRMREAIGAAETDASPIRRVDSIQAPVLLFHGTLDVNERIDQSRRMRDVLEKAGKKVELVEFDGLGRNLEGSTARAQMLLKMGQLLDRTIGH
jgi:dipeptidyl aminopeptidase/acylaminoacyl peptidase